MMYRARFVLVLAAILAMMNPRPVAAAPLKEELLKDWLEMKQLMTRLAEEMPAEKYSFKATPPQRTYAEQIMHVATSNVIGIGTLKGKTPAPTLDRAASSKADVLKALALSFDYGTAVLNEQTEQSLTETIDAVRYLGPSSRARAVWFLLGHSWDIYGQMAVYLRLSGGVPPASQRP